MYSTFTLTRSEMNIIFLLFELNTMGAVSDELLLHTSGTKWNDNYTERLTVDQQNLFEAIHRFMLTRGTQPRRVC